MRFRVVVEQNPCTEASVYTDPHKIACDGAQEVTIQSRHGLITHAELTRAPPEDGRAAATELCELMVGDRYETLERTSEAVEKKGSARHRERMSEMIEWLQREM